MKNKLFFLVVLAIVSIGCERLISEKVIEVRTFTPTINYLPSFFIETKDGLIFNLTKKYYVNEKLPANLRCENAVSEKKIIFKTDFDGNILFEKNTDSLLDYNLFFRKDDKLFSFSNFTLTEFDNELNPIDKMAVSVEKVETDGFQADMPNKNQLFLENKNDFAVVTRLHKNGNQSKLGVITVKNRQVENFATNEVMVQNSETIMCVVGLPSNDLFILTSFYDVGKSKTYSRLQKYNAAQNTLTLEAELPQDITFENVLLLTDDAQKVILVPQHFNLADDTFKVYLYDFVHKTLTLKPLAGIQNDNNSSWLYNERIRPNLWISTYENGKLFFYEIKPDLSFRKVPAYLGENSYMYFSIQKGQRIYSLSPTIWGDKQTQTRLLWQTTAGDVSDKVLFTGTGLRDCFNFD